MLMPTLYKRPYSHVLIISASAHASPIERNVPSIEIRENFHPKSRLLADYNTVFGLYQWRNLGSDLFVPPFMTIVIFEIRSTNFRFVKYTQYQFIITEINSSRTR